LLREPAVPDKWPLSSVAKNRVPERARLFSKAALAAGRTFISFSELNAPDLLGKKNEEFPIIEQRELGWMFYEILAM
jgi:hypothetical protein